MLNSTDHETATAHKNENVENKNVACDRTRRCCIYHANKC